MSNDRSVYGDHLIQNHVLKKLKRFPYRTLRQFPLLDKVCPYCNIKLHSAEQSIKSEEEEEQGVIWFSPVIARAEYCPNCLYWRIHHLETFAVDRGGIHEVHKYTSYISKLQEFESNMPDQCTSELVQWLKRDILKVHQLNPTRLEKLVADIFRANYANVEVIHVGRPDDGGIDVIFIENEHKKWLIQVKRREHPKSAEPVQTIRNLLGTMYLEQNLYGIVVSTADHFTHRAYAAANRASEIGSTIRLIDRGKLAKMLDPLLPQRPWLNIIAIEYPDLIELFSKGAIGTHGALVYEQLKMFT